MSEYTSGSVQLLFVTSRTSGIGRRMESIVASLEARNRGRVPIRKVYVDAEPELAERLGIRMIPTVVFLRGGRLMASVRGRATLDELERALEACE